ncbi:chorismate mutase [Buchnera aphidicola]|uniref:Bifunctional chorismate mutase/prephenate dehydratase n=1 Tax=Buchnera aphidicola (Sarucallis kahawaluokalani) TaxID=1241878 RepID=A0A4D6YM28_9GAMM|nr:chorismate mutase [Buchnera aphidicola]QCI26055.1 chorismate mutase [Buchnera aphidicola (Sarucallis kahawaluokalani)]
MQTKKILLKLRHQINEIDELILQLLSKRRKVAIKIGKKKIINNLPIKDKIREKELLKELYQIGKMYQLPKEYIKQIFYIIVTDSVIIQNIVKKKSIQHQNIPKKIFCCLGPCGSYSYIISMKFLKKYQKNYILHQYHNFRDMFSSLEKKKSEYAIVPIENSSSGFIHEVYNLLCQKKFNIVGECYLPIQHCLLVKKNTQIENIKNVYSHHQALQQCSKFIKKFNKWNLRYTKSTAEAMQMISNHHTNDTAAIGDQCNAKIYQLNIIFKKISNCTNNTTRFLILSTKKTTLLNLSCNKTTLLLKTQEILLFQIIMILYIQKISVVQLQSELYNKKNFKEKIYLEINENIEQKNVQKILTLLQKKNISVKILGCYPVYNIS